MAIEEGLLPEDHPCKPQPATQLPATPSRHACQAHSDVDDEGRTNKGGSDSHTACHWQWSQEGGPMQQGLTCKHAPQAPEVQRVVIVLQVHQKLRALEVARGHPHIVPAGLAASVHPTG